MVFSVLWCLVFCLNVTCPLLTQWCLVFCGLKTKIIFFCDIIILYKCVLMKHNLLILLLDRYLFIFNVSTRISCLHCMLNSKVDICK